MHYLHYAITAEAIATPLNIAAIECRHMPKAATPPLRAMPRAITPR